MKRLQKLAAGMLLVGLPALATGCISARRATHTPRTATEQLLVSLAAERAVAALEWPALDGRTVSIETVSLNAADAAYLQVAAEDRARALGARVVGVDAAEVRVQLLVGALGTVGREAEFGIPELPTPFGVATPSIAFVKTVRQHGWAKVRLVARDAGGAHVFTGDPVMEKTRFDIHSVFFFAIRVNDIYPDQASFGID